MRSRHEPDGEAATTSPPELLLTVFDAATRAAMPGAAVQFANYGKALPPEVSTDGSGHARFAPLSTAPGVYACVRADGYVPITLEWPAGGVPAAYDVRLARGVTVGGRVVDVAGRPVGGATVVLSSRVANEVERHGWLPVERPGVGHIEVITAADGAWHFAGMPDNFIGVDIGVHHAGYVSHAFGCRGYFPIDSFDDRDGLLNRSFTLTLERGLAIHGTVLDEHARPVVGAKVGLGNDRVASNRAPEMETDAGGRFTAHARPGETVTLTARFAGHAPQLVTFVMPDADHAAVLTLEPPRTLSGRVVDPQGRPIGGAGIVIDTWRGARTISERLTADTDGRFSFVDAPGDEVLVNVGAEGFAERRGLPVIASSENVLKLRAPLRVDGVVLDADTGRPVTTFTVVPGIDHDADRPINWQRQDYGAGDVMHVTDPAGRFAWTFDGDYRAMALRIEADGYRPAERRNILTDGGPQTATFRLTPAESVSIVVTDPAGRPRPGVVAAVAIPGVAVHVENDRFARRDRDALQAKTDAAGRLTLPPQADAFRVVLIDDIGIADLGPADFAAGGSVALKPWAAVVGTVAVGDRPAGGAKVRAFGHDARDEADTGDGRPRPHVYYQSDTIADADGAFRFDRMPEAKYVVVHDVPAIDYRHVWLAQQAVTPEPGRTTTIRLGGTGRAVVGSIARPPEAADRPWNDYDAALIIRSPEHPTPFPADWADRSAGDRKHWHADPVNAEAAQAYASPFRPGNAERKHYDFVLHPSGAFRVEDVDPGNYTLVIALRGPRNAHAGGRGATFAHGHASVTIPPLPQGETIGDAVTLEPVEMTAVAAAG